MIEAIFWDFGGVLTTSPFDAFSRFEQENGLPENFIRKINATNPDTNAWARLERSDSSLEEFDREFEQETRSAGYAVRGAEVLELLTGDLRPEMVAALQTCGRHFPNACLTNNIKSGAGGEGKISADRASEFGQVMALFDYVVESSKVGIRKPDPRFYEMACKIVKVDPARVVFLDDLGINLKPARAMGMTTIKVTSSAQALNELEKVLGLGLT